MPDHDPNVGSLLKCLAPQEVTRIRATMQRLEAAENERTAAAAEANRVVATEPASTTVNRFRRALYGAEKAHNDLTNLLLAACERLPEGSEAALAFRHTFVQSRDTRRQGFAADWDTVKRLDQGLKNLEAKGRKPSGST